jgi:uncharacterized protein YdaU (DUF1376 family)
VHYYQFNIGDFASHTAHLDPIEDAAYRRMLDYCYLHEIGLPETVDEIARLIRMRTHCECIANVLREFFVQRPDGSWCNERVDREIALFREKSGKAASAARKRWENPMRTHSERTADAMQDECERNANHKPLTINHKPIVRAASASQFVKPSFDEVQNYCLSRRSTVNPTNFIDYYDSVGWMIGKKKMKDWQAAVRTWEKNDSQKPKNTIIESVVDRSWADD